MRLVEQAARVDSRTAEQALLDAEADVKTAIAMLRLHVSASEARARLAAADGRLRAAFGEAPPPLD